MKRISQVFCLVLISAATIVTAQTPSAPKPTPQLTEVQKLKAENLSLKYSQAEQSIKAIQDQESKLRVEYQNLVAEVEKEYPGYTVDVNTLSLVEKVVPPAPKPVEEPKK